MDHVVFPDEVAVRRDLEAPFFPFRFHHDFVVPPTSLSSSRANRAILPPAAFSVIVFCTAAGSSFIFTGSLIGSPARAELSPRTVLTATVVPKCLGFIVEKIRLTSPVV